MAVSSRPNTLTTHALTVLSCLLLVLAHASDVAASPSPLPPHPSAAVDLSTHWKRVTPIVKTSEIGNNVTVHPQGLGTDGGGVDFSVPAIIWLVFVLLTGAPLAIAGIRLWRVTTGLAIGLGTTLCVWAAFNNTVSADGLSDIVLAVVSMGGFAVGFVGGLLDFGRWPGILLIGVLGGLSIGVRVVLLRPGLLIDIYIVNWLVLAAFMALGLAGVLLRQRVGILSGCAAIGSFLVALAADLVIERQRGMSFALRFLFDRNNSHFLDIVHRGYNPSLTTQIILGASVAVIPLLAYGQHKIFKGPFRRKSDVEEGALFDDIEPGSRMSELKLPPTRASRMQLLKSRFSLS
ncbi:hypothetical protein C8Q80DRAFT_1217409 [Daedaleopsis nitida]|nr:hypothetical protein C8Q80DRAFT_1217409 [Daedaleopsis nitida]